MWQLTNSTTEIEDFGKTLIPAFCRSEGGFAQLPQPAVKLAAGFDLRWILDS